MKRKPKRRPDGRWQRRAKGKLFISSISQEDADRQAKEYVKLLEAGMNKNADTMTVAEYARAWLPRNRSSVSDDTYSAEAHRIDVLCDHIGSMLIKDVIPSNITDVYKAYLTGKSKSLANKTKDLYQNIFESAVEDGFCRRNPCTSKSAKTPEGFEGSHRALEPWERQLIENQKDDELYPLLMLMLYTGMRPSEAMAVDVGRDVDFEVKTITIHEVRRLSSNKAYLSQKGKTKKAVGRVLPLFSPLESVLAGRVGKLCLSSEGELPSRGTWQAFWDAYTNRMECVLNGHRKRWHHRTKDDPLLPEIKKLMDAGKVEQAENLRFSDWKTFSVRPYDLRHEFCTWCCYHGVDMHTLIDWMGHKNYKMVQQIYDHVTAERVEREVEKLEKTIKSSQISSQG